MPSNNNTNDSIQQPNDLIYAGNFHLKPQSDNLLPFDSSVKFYEFYAPIYMLKKNTKSNYQRSN